MKIDEEQLADACAPNVIWTRDSAARMYIAASVIFCAFDVIRYCYITRIMYIMLENV